MKRSTGNEKARTRFQKSRLGAVARSLRDWLDELLQEPGADKPELGTVGADLNADAAPVGQDAIGQLRNPFEPAPPPDAWVKIAQEYAPRLLVPPEHGGTQWQYAAGMDEEAGLQPRQTPARARVEMPKNPARRSDAPKRISDRMPDVSVSMGPLEKAEPKKLGLLAQLSGKLHTKANHAAPARQASRDVADESARVLKLSTQPSKRVDLHAIDNQSHSVSGESPLGQVPAHKKASAVARREPLRKRVRSLLQQMGLNRGVWPSQTAKLQLVNAAKQALQNRTMERKPVVSALQSVESGSADANPVFPAPSRNYSRAPQMLTVPPSQRPLRTGIREKIVTERSPSKSVPATWPSLRFPAQNVSDHTRIGSRNLEGKQKESAHVAESPKAHVGSSTWSSAAATDDRWPELPDHFPAKTGPALALRTAEHQRALDLEQRGGR